MCVFNRKIFSDIFERTSDEQDLIGFSLSDSEDKKSVQFGPECVPQVAGKFFVKYFTNLVKYVFKKGILKNFLWFF